MGKFNEVLESISKEYKVNKMTTSYAQIELDELFDWCNYMFIGVYYREIDNQVILTDNADYAELCNIEEKDLPTINKICQKHHITFNNWYIECIYQSNQDVKHYLECLRELKKKYADKD